MKIKTIERGLDDTTPIHGAPPVKKRNLDPSLHPFQRAREYNRAKTAAKLDRMFAKPFVAALEGHVDGVYCMAKDPKALSCVASGSSDGSVVVWNLAARNALRKIKAHKGQVGDLCFATGSSGMAESSSRAPGLWGNFDGNADRIDQAPEADLGAVRRSARILTCSTDKTVKMWATTEEDAQGLAPLKVWTGRNGFNSISHHQTDDVFATASDQVQIWDYNKSEPIHNLSFASLPQSRGSKEASSGEHLTCVRFSPSETSVLASTSADRSICFYDLRTASPTHRATLNMRCNQIAWNPLQPPVILLACENEDLYTFDIRNLSSATQVYKDHVGPVMSCDWSPSGRSFVSGAYDKTVRLWDIGRGRSKDVYHTSRMQRVFSTVYTYDTKFVLSGSDDGNVRVWKSNASASLHHQTSKELASRQYRDALRKKYASLPEIGRIERQRFVPKDIHGKGRIKREMLGAQKRREDNRRAHKPNGEEVGNPVSERKKAILQVD